MTGAPAYYVKINQSHSLDLLKEAVRKNYIITATSVPNKEEKQKLMQKGILTLQSYSLLRQERVPTHDGGYVDIIQLRNPWGNFEWKGDFSDESPVWTEEAKRICDLKVADDGFFWMSWDDF